jgi:chromosome segregation protein
MLNRLELVGFKSFADKTVFDFGDGITAIVGPNGSGKSNIVDAVRWILGEQSAKSLRGGEMADVIFNGSSSRRSLGLAEVTMTFDNMRSHLALDAQEVQITRRVYRSGEGEYLINGQVCRLKDIKDLFLGSGAGNDAYCIIAQGKVDVLLQASTRDRRSIFEEAAGISRFKAKKIETLRKLERVDQNLQRVRDIIEEVEKQLRTVKLQASKAQRFQEYSQRLRALRVALGLKDYHRLTEALRREEAQLNQLRGELDQRAARAGACEAEAERLEILLADLDDALHEGEGALARVLGQIRAEETTLTREAALTADLEAELGRTRSRLGELTARVGTLAETVARSAAEYTEADTHAARHRQDVAERTAALTQTKAWVDALHEQLTHDKAEHLDQMRRAAHRQNEAVAARAQLDNLRRERDRLRHRSAQAAENLASIDVELDELVAAEAEVNDRLGAARRRLQEARHDQERLGQLRDRTTEHISELRQQRSGLDSRAVVLDGLIKSREGLGAGVREVIGLIEQPEPGPWAAVLGMIADFLTVKREYAPLIDIALGEWAQRFIVRDIDRLAAALGCRREPFAGRVSFLPLAAGGERAGDGTARAELRRNRLVQLSLLSRVRQPGEKNVTPEHPGMVAAADQLVSCDHPELGDLPAQLLGRTLVVRDLATARAIAEHAPGFRLVTLAGELLEPDGTLTVGTHHAETGILSRNSELRELRELVVRLDARLVDLERDLADLRDRVLDAEQQAQEEQEQIDVLGEQAADLRGRVQRHRDRRQGLHEEVTVSRDEMQRIDEEFAGLERTWHESQAQAAEAEAQVQILHARMHEADEELRHKDRDRQLQQASCTDAQVALATAEERLRSLEVQHQQLEREQRQRGQELLLARQSLADGRAKMTESQATMLRATAVLAQAYLDKEGAQRRCAELAQQREQKRQERGRLTQQAQAVRAEWRKHQETVHERDLEVSNLRHQRATLVQRLKDDYQLDLAQLYAHSYTAKNAADAEKVSGPFSAATVPDEPVTNGSAAMGPDTLSGPALSVPALTNPEEINAEIEELRRKLSRLGSVNLDSLAELNELETRSASLTAQFDDLTGAKKNLDEIIGKINQDSRTLFIDTFTAIRAHFQELFRKLFGGGMADVVLEDEADVLESGIEVIARPPGKELRSISLMSGGEKTMTAVALLLAIFRSKPSPFCLLDEVDAALDEANISRFTAVLREFLDQSQFIIVTHSKKTMAAADVLYGITMQESGISKQVAVRFEDWVEDEPKGEDAA